MLKLNTWQNNRLFWLLMTIITFSLNILALYYYQFTLGQQPCEYCVYQRLAIFIISIGCIIISFNPKWLYCKLTGLLILTMGSFYGLYEVIKQLYLQFNRGDLFAACSLKPSFPFNLPLDDWLPFVFKIQADCHAENPTFLGVSFTYWLLLIFIGCSLFCVYLWFIKIIKRYH